MFCSREVLSRWCSRRICLAVEIKIEWNPSRPSLKIPPVYLDASLPPTGPVSIPGIHHIISCFPTVFIPFLALAPPESGWHLLSASLYARLLFCYRITIYHNISYHIIASQIVPVNQCQHSYCIALFVLFLSTYLITLWAPQGEGPVSALSTMVPLIQLALYKCTKFLFLFNTWEPCLTSSTMCNLFRRTSSTFFHASLGPFTYFAWYFHMGQVT